MKVLLMVELFSKDSLIPELQDPATWMKMKCLKKGGRIMVNVGGSCVEVENKYRDGKVVMEETLKAMKVVFGAKLFVLSLGNVKDDSSLALRGFCLNLMRGRRLTNVLALRSGYKQAMGLARKHIKLSLILFSTLIMPYEASFHNGVKPMASNHPNDPAVLNLVNQHQPLPQLSKIRLEIFYKSSHLAALKTSDQQQMRSAFLQSGMQKTVWPLLKLVQ